MEEHVLLGIPEVDGQKPQSELPKTIQNYLLELDGDNGRGYLFYRMDGKTFYVLDYILRDIVAFKKTAPDELFCFVCDFIVGEIE